MKILVAFIAGVAVATGCWVFFHTPRLSYTLVEEISNNEECAVIVIGHSSSLEPGTTWTSLSTNCEKMGGFKVLTYSSREAAEAKLKEIIQKVEP